MVLIEVNDILVAVEKADDFIEEEFEALMKYSA